MIKPDSKIDQILDALWKELYHRHTVGGRIEAWRWDVTWKRSGDCFTVSFNPHISSSEEEAAEVTFDMGKLHTGAKDAPQPHSKSVLEAAGFHPDEDCPGG